MKSISFIFTIVFAFCFSSLYSQEFETDPTVNSLELKVQDSICVKKIEFYKGNVEFIDRIKQDSLCEGSVKIIQDYRIDDLLKIDRAENIDVPGFQGYRIQVFSGGGRDREKAVIIKNDLEERFPNDKVYLKYHAPDFRVLIGNFRSNLEAVYLYKKCLKIYPNSYIRRDQIDLVDLEVQEKIKIEEIE